MAEEEGGGIGIGGFLLGWAGLGVLLELSIQKTRREQEHLREVYADALGITVEEARRRLDASLPRPPLRVNKPHRVKVRRLTHQEAWSALRQGRYMEACRERVREAEEAAVRESAQQVGK